MKNHDKRKNQGLAAGFAGAHDLDALRRLLGIPAAVTPVGVVLFLDSPPPTRA